MYQVVYFSTSSYMMCKYVGNMEDFVCFLVFMASGYFQLAQLISEATVLMNCSKSFFHSCRFLHLKSVYVTYIIQYILTEKSVRWNHAKHCRNPREACHLHSRQGQKFIGALSKLRKS